MNRSQCLLAGILLITSCANNPVITSNPQNNLDSKNSTTVKADYQYLDVSAQKALVSPQEALIPFIKGQNVNVPDVKFEDSLPARLEQADKAESVSPFTGDLLMNLNALKISDLKKVLATLEDMSGYQIAILSPTILKTYNGQAIVKKIPKTRQEVLFKNLPAEQVDVLIRPLDKEGEPLVTITQADFLINPGHLNKLNTEVELLEVPSEEPSEGPDQKVHVALVSANGVEMRQESDSVSAGGSLTFDGNPTPLPPLEGQSNSTPVVYETKPEGCQTGTLDYTQVQTGFQVDEALPPGLTLNRSFLESPSAVFDGVTASSTNQLSILYKGISVEKDLNLEVVSGASDCSGEQAISSVNTSVIKRQENAQGIQTKDPATSQGQDAIEKAFEDTEETYVADTLGSEDNTSQSQNSKDSTLSSCESGIQGASTLETTLGIPGETEDLGRPDVDGFEIIEQEGETLNSTGSNETITIDAKEESSGQSECELARSVSDTNAEDVQSTDNKPTLKRFEFTESKQFYYLPNQTGTNLNNMLLKVFGDGLNHNEIPVKWTSEKTQVAEVTNGVVKLKSTGDTKITAVIEGYPNQSASMTISVRQFQSTASQPTTNQPTSTPKPVNNTPAEPTYIKPTGEFALSKYRVTVGDTVEINVKPNTLNGSYSKIKFDAGAFGIHEYKGSPVSIKATKKGNFYIKMYFIDTRGKTVQGYPSSHLLGVIEKETVVKKIDTSSKTYVYAANSPIDPKTNQKVSWSVSLGLKVVPNIDKNTMSLDIRRLDGNTFSNAGTVTYYINDTYADRTEYSGGVKNISRGITINYLKSKAPKVNKIHAILKSYNPENKVTTTLKTGTVTLTKYY